MPVDNAIDDSAFVLRANRFKQINICQYIILVKQPVGQLVENGNSNGLNIDLIAQRLQ